MEGKLISEFDHVLVTSETDRNALLELTPPGVTPAPISVLSNGVDLEFFHPSPDVQRDEETLIFSGKMSYHANISMVKFLVAEIMPRIWANRPKVQLLIVGKDPTADVRALGADPRITVTGTVDDIRPYLWKATVAVVPLIYGAGIQNKILEAMAMGVPVVTTSVAAGGVDAVAGEHLLTADTPEQTCAAILRVLNDPAERARLARAGRERMLSHHAWPSSMRRLDGIIQRCRETFRPASGLSLQTP
jgi:glycosyltransferase involved in cell wall biosynthesis